MIIFIILFSYNFLGLVFLFCIFVMFYKAALNDAKLWNYNKTMSSLNVLTTYTFFTEKGKLYYENKHRV